MLLTRLVDGGGGCCARFEQHDDAGGHWDRSRIGARIRTVFGRQISEALEDRRIVFEVPESMGRNDKGTGAYALADGRCSVISGNRRAVAQVRIRPRAPSQGDIQWPWVKGSTTKVSPSGEVTLQGQFRDALHRELRRKIMGLVSSRILPVYDAFARMKSPMRIGTRTSSLVGIGLLRSAYWSTDANPADFRSILPRACPWGFYKRF